MPSPDTAQLKLGDAEREVAMGEATAVLEATTSQSRREELATLLTSIETGELSETDAASLERVIELALQAGRIRAIYGPGGEQAALRLYRRLPHGSAAAQSAREVTAALASLQGRTLDSASVEVVGPGAFSISLSVDGRALSLRLDRQGARLASVAA